MSEVPNADTEYDALAAQIRSRVRGYARYLAVEPDNGSRVGAYRLPSYLGDLQHPYLVAYAGVEGDQDNDLILEEELYSLTLSRDPLGERSPQPYRTLFVGSEASELRDPGALVMIDSKGDWGLSLAQLNRVQYMLDTFDTLIPDLKPEHSTEVAIKSLRRHYYGADSQLED